MAPPADVAQAGRSTEEQATDPGTAPAYMARAVLSFNEQLERLGELAVVVVVGAMLADIEALRPGIVLAVGLFVVIRPLATMLTLVRTPLSRPQRAFIAWFGVRGVGSVYYLAYALSHGLSGPTARMLADITLVVVAASIVLHGVSVTPLIPGQFASCPSFGCARGRTVQRSEERVRGGGHSLPGVAEQDVSTRDGMPIEAAARVAVRTKHTAPNRSIPANRPRARGSESISAVNCASVAAAPLRPTGPAATDASAPSVSLSCKSRSIPCSFMTSRTRSVDSAPICTPKLPFSTFRNTGALQP